jgi:uncharacterized cupredoxin-like copper-binding protein
LTRARVAGPGYSYNTHINRSQVRTPSGEAVTDGRARRLSPAVRRALPWFLAALLCVTFGLPSAVALAAAPSAPQIGVGHPAAGNTSVTVNMTDQPAFTPRSVTGNANATLSVQLVNQGVYNHTFTMVNVPNLVLNASWSPATLDSFFAKNGSLANVSVAPGQTAWANITFNASVGGDSFEFASVVPYQFQAGMWGFVNLTASGPGTELMENTTDSYAFVPNVLYIANPHYPLIVDVLVTNTGSLGHTFTVSSLSNYTLSPANFSQTFATNAPFVNAPIPSGAGSSAWANFTVRAPGVYQYICTVPGHFANGMTGDLYIAVPPPPPTAAPSTAVVDTWVLLGSGVLLGIGVLVAVIASYTGRFPSPPKSHEGHH